MSTPERRAQDLLEQVSGTGIPVAQLLCDRHDPQAVAFTVVEQDLSRRDLTYGHLTERSQRAAAALAELASVVSGGLASRNLRVPIGVVVQSANTSRLRPMKNVWSWPVLGSAALYFALFGVPSGTCSSE